MEKNPLVSVILPSHNRSSLLPHAVESVLAQTFADWELIIVLDSCSDDSAAVAARYQKSDPRIRVMEVKARNVSSARNKAMVSSRGKYIALLDDDDIWRSDKLQSQVLMMEKYPDAAVCFTDGTLFQGERTIKDGLVAKNNPYLAKWMKENQTADSKFYKGNLFEVLLFVNCVVISTAMFRRSVSESVGYFDLSLQGCEGYDFWLRISRQHLMAFLNQSTVDYRLSEVGLMGNMESRGYVTRESDSKVLDRHYHAMPAAVKPKVARRISEIAALAGWYFMKIGEFRRARTLFLRSLKYKIFQPKTLVYFVLSLFKMDKPKINNRENSQSGPSKRFLLLLPSLPIPANSGGQMRSLNFLKYLASRGSVTLICPGDADKNAAGVTALREFTKDIHFVNPDSFGPHSKDGRKQPVLSRITALFRMRPWILSDFISDGLKQTLLSLDLKTYDAIVIRYPILAYYFYTEKLLARFCHKVIMDADDILPLMQERRVKGMKAGYAKVRHWLEWVLLKNYYKKMKRIKTILVTSERDKQYLLKEKMADSAQSVWIVPNVVDIPEKSVLKAPGTSPHEILFCGSLSFVHNEEAVQYFCEQVLPLIRREVPDAVFTVIGKNPTAKVLSFSNRPGVDVVGPVESTEPYYQRAGMAVIPILNGAGTRIKVLEAMAFGTPVVSTSVGAEGIDVTPGKDILIGDSPELMAEQCVRLIKNPGEREKLSTEGRRLVEAKYDLQAFDRIMDQATQTGKEKSKLRDSKLDNTLSIVICTYNRADSLKETLASVLTQKNGKVPNVEILVVDNNSKDHTKSVVEKFTENTPGNLKYVFEPRQGVAYARNTAVEHAAGGIIAFLDDDVIVEQGWLNGLWKCFAETDADAVGGRISQKWNVERPSWFSDELNGCLISQEFGDVRKIWKNPQKHMVTANLAFRRGVFEKYGKFREELGRRGDSLLGGEDREIFQRLMSEGGTVYYEPEARVHHKVETERLTKDYFRRWYRDIGKTLGHEIPWKPAYFLTVAPLWLWKNYFKSVLRKIRSVVTRAAESERFTAQVWLTHYGAMISERIYHWMPFGVASGKCIFHQRMKSHPIANHDKINLNAKKELEYECAN